MDLWAGPGSCLKETVAVTVHYFSKYRVYLWRWLFVWSLLCHFGIWGLLNVFALCYVAPHK